MKGAKAHPRTPLPLDKEVRYLTMPDGSYVDVTIDWRDVYLQCKRAFDAVSQEAVAGPVRIKVPKLQPQHEQPKNKGGLLINGEPVHVGFPRE